ncbi:hypothetical protein TELCIR_10415 [Teladorsagia circumcincta]|uniref:60S ribosome subunit biogenesis protein NIP7 homolog n=2 Tax=Teladorsagia circumcincta TaxID=45464 RepID=A0A2G9UC65_TELCI|nr:hypothetical protein TELCIR_10415 [Teladorsagia circumcincta]
MRPLTNEETEQVFAKLASFIGDNVALLIERADGDYCFRNHKYRVWLKPNAEQQFLYGNNILKSGIARMTEGIPSHAGIVVYNMNDMPLGFGVAGKGTAESKRADPTAVVVLHQCDLGEYHSKRK